MNHLRLSLLLLCACYTVSVTSAFAQSTTPKTTSPKAMPTSEVKEKSDTTKPADATESSAESKTETKKDTPVAATVTEAASKTPEKKSKLNPSSKPVKQAQVANTIPLKEMLRTSLHRAPGVQAAKADQLYAKWQQYRANRAWFPDISANTFLSVVPDNTDPNRFNENIDELLSLNVGPFVRQTIRMVVPLYTFDRITTAQSMADLGVENARVKLRKSKVELAFDIKRAYHSMALALAFDALLEDGGKLFKKELQKMKDARDFGDADFKIKDFRKLQIFETDFESRALDNEKLKTLSLSGLQYLTGKKHKAEVVAPLDDKQSIAPIEDLNTYLNVAMRKRPEVVQLNKAIRLRKLQMEMKKSDFYPNIYFAADFTYGWSTETVARQPVCRIPANSTECVQTDDLFARAYANPFAQRSFGVLLGMRWNFNYPQLYGKYKEAEATLIKTRHQRRQALGAIRLEIKKLHIEAVHAYKKVGLQARRLKAAERWRNQLGFGAQQGGSVNDALDPVKAYFEARILYLQAIYNYHIARAALAKGIGVTTLKVAEGSVTKKK